MNSKQNKHDNQDKHNGLIPFVVSRVGWVRRTTQITPRFKPDWPCAVTQHWAAIQTPNVGLRRAKRSVIILSMLPCASNPTYRLSLHHRHFRWSSKDLKEGLRTQISRRFASNKPKQTAMSTEQAARIPLRLTLATTSVGKTSR